MNSSISFDKALGKPLVQVTPFHSSWLFLEYAELGATLASHQNFGPTYSSHPRYRRNISLHTLDGDQSNHAISVIFCHWPSIKRRRIHLSSETFLPNILDTLYSEAWRLCSLRAWNISDSALLTILLRLVDAFAPALTEVSIKGNPTFQQAFFWTSRRFGVPFLINNCTPCLCSLEIYCFSIQTYTMPSSSCAR